MATVSDLLLRLLREVPGCEAEDFFENVNAAIEEIRSEFGWKFYEKKYSFTLETALTGTDGSVTNGSTTVTMAAGVITASQIGWKIRFDGHSGTYTISNASDGGGTTTVTLDRAYSGDTDAEIAYTTYKDTYSVPSDFERLIKLKNATQNEDMEFIPLYAFLEDYPGANGTSTLIATQFTLWGVDNTGYRQILIGIAPSTADTMDLYYRRKHTAPTAPTSTVDVSGMLGEALYQQLLLRYLLRQPVSPANEVDVMLMARIKRAETTYNKAIARARKLEVLETPHIYRNRRILI